MRGPTAATRTSRYHEGNSVELLRVSPPDDEPDRRLRRHDPAKKHRLSFSTGIPGQASRGLLVRCLELTQGKLFGYYISTHNSLSTRANEVLLSRQKLSPVEARNRIFGPQLGHLASRRVSDAYHPVLHRKNHPRNNLKRRDM